MEDPETLLSPAPVFFVRYPFPHFLLPLAERERGVRLS